MNSIINGTQSVRSILNIIDTEKTRKNEGGQQEIIYKLRDLSVIDMHDLSKDKTDKE